ncbi:MAG TPA: T9SS type A sorting domain-containing protein, partial [Flavobacterium sp.]|nr:T9SS type A sorting domain-containing protein [Flavobacterium sp.]
TPNPVVKVVGSAVTNSPVEMTTKDGKMYTAKKVAIQPGLCQFNIDGVILGGNTFPNGSALSETEYIPISTTGIDYDITFDYTTAEYTFKVATFPGVALVGAGAGGWPGEPGNPGPIDNNQMTTTDGVTYKLEGVALTTGSVKFRQDNAWNNNWGGETFPTGPGSSDKTKDIPAVAGAYNVTFNITNGDYNFEVITYAIVGSAVGGWPGEPGNPGPIDVHQMTTTDGVNYTLDGLVCTDGGAKFRLNNAWNGGDWGGTTFPEGMGKSSSDIPVKAGTYNLSMNRVTGDYKFDDGLSVRDFTAAGFRAYPNPTKNYWNITSANDAITSVQVYDMLGKSVMVLTPSSNEVSVNSSKLSKGIYFAKVSTATASSTVKLIKE